MENDIIINKATCIKCRLCAEVCPNKIIFTNNSGEMSIRADRATVCFKCGQCMSICSTKSICINGLSYEHDFFIPPENTPLETTFYNLIYTRRAIRNFKDNPVPKELLEKVVEAISFAPPGFPPLKTEIIIVQNRELIKKALPYMVDLFDFLYKAMRNPFMRFVIKREVGTKKFASLRNHLIPLLKTRLPELKTGVEDTITRHAPAMILFHGNQDEEDIQADIYVAATYGMLAAHSLGLGGSIMDIIPPAINKKKELMKMFCIPENHIVLTSIIIGYPKYRYQRGIKRNLKSIRWL